MDYNYRSDGSIKLPDHSLPSDYSDVQPDTYDPEYISQISSKMQVPHRIGVGQDMNMKGPEYMNGLHDGGSRYAGMSVPDKIIVAVDSSEDMSTPGAAEEIQRLVKESSCNFPDMRIPYTLVLSGENQHIGMRPDRILDLGPSPQLSSDSLSYVGLITPPRVLTLEENFPAVEDYEEQRDMSANAGDGQHMVAMNGHINGPLPYNPSVNINDTVLLNEEDEATLLRTQVAKLTRRVQVIELENQKRVNRELVMYPMILGYFLWKVLGWLTRDR